MIASDWQIQGFKKIAETYNISFVKAVVLTHRIFKTTVVTAGMIEFMVNEVDLVCGLDCVRN